MPGSRFVLPRLLVAIATCCLLLATMQAPSAIANGLGHDVTTNVDADRKAVHSDERRFPSQDMIEAHQRRLLAKASPDECFVDIGEPYPPGPPCADGQPKVNQAYVWGLAQAGTDLWFGTAPNVHCLVIGSFLGTPNPNRNADWVCEFGESQPAQQIPQLPAELGDWRPPRIFVYDVSADQLTDKIPDIATASPLDAQRLAATVGIRAAGAHDGIALLAGPSLARGINVFAFDTATGGYLGSTTLTEYSNIRTLDVIDGALYAGVAATTGPRGRVLRWTGDHDRPFTFIEVGTLPEQAAEVAGHEGRLFVTTWPAADVGEGPDVADAGIAGLWMSPPAGEESGLTEADAEGWSRVWSAADYEPDPLVARTYGGGALASYGGHLYWGTMHVPLLATVVHVQTHPPEGRAETAAAVAGTQRAISVFRGRGFADGQPQVELLYGQRVLPAFDPSADGAGGWRLEETGYEPLFGPSGFGNLFNNYTWSMGVSQGRLFVGTMDWSYLAVRGLPQILEQLGARWPLPPTGKPLGRVLAAAGLGGNGFGADLWAFPEPAQPARPVDTRGVGNPLNYGIRRLLATEDALYLGMANPMNLRTDQRPGTPAGGWELLELSLP